MVVEEEIIVVGQCPICGRDMWAGGSIDKHHFIPKSRGGKVTEFVHRICHNTIHSVFTEKELANEYNDAELVIAHPIIQKFINWVKNKVADFYIKTKPNKNKKNKK